jgi:HD-GYP domain-containing protein (c-di-GMP phosphodiesterase class II)
VRDLAIVVAGYPWEVGAYEIPLLRALTRHWAVFERIRFEAIQAEQAFFTTMEALALAAEFYDTETARHISRVSAYATELAQAVGCDAGFVKWLARSSQMHDVGKITIPIELIRKASPLSPEDRHLLVHHTVNGARLLGDLKPLAMARAIALSHHENFDGSGYPQGLRGDEIPIEARIVRIADVYDALRTERPYKHAFGHQQTLDVLREGDGRVEPAHFDPRLLQVFLGLEREMARIYDESAAGGGDITDRVDRGDTLRWARMEGT